MLTGVERCNAYADGVLSGEILAPLTIKQACKRYKNDFKKKKFYFDEYAANAAVHNMERLTHAKGAKQGQRIVLEPWQCFSVCNIFGWKWTRNGKRRFRKAYERIPRKNGKTTKAICIAINMFGPDMEPGAEVYLGATGEKQARRVLFEPTKYMVDRNVRLKDRFGIEVNAGRLVIPENMSFLEAVIRKPDDGTNPHCAVVDEYHLHEDSSQLDTFSTGMGSREQPLLLVITTAGSNLSGPCKSLDDDCLRLLRGEHQDDTTFVMIFCLDDGDDWRDIKNWEKVNPNIGVTISKEYLKSQLKLAMRSAEDQNDIRTKHLNEWIGAAKAWMNILIWQKRSKPKLFEEFKEFPAMGAVDLAARKDCNAVSLLFKNDEGKYFHRPVFYIPEGALERNKKYQAYKNTGELIITPGRKTDQARIEEDILEWHEQFDIKGWGFDDYQGDYIMTRLMDQGLNVVNYGATVKNFSAPMKEVDALTESGDLYNDGNGCMVWMMGNVVCFVDQKDCIFPRKENKNDEKSKIDGPVSLIMSMGMWMAEDEEGEAGIIYV